MSRGAKKHMKRLNAPKHWMLSKMGGVFAPKPAAGPHKNRECLPLSIILRNRLKYALTRKESSMIVMQRLVKVDNKVRTELNFPAGFCGTCNGEDGGPRSPPPPPPPPARADVISLEKSKEKFRLLYDTKGRFVLHKVGDGEATFKLCRIVADGTSAKTVPYIVTHDGRTLRYPDPAIKVNDTVKLDLTDGKVKDFIKFEVGNTVMVTKGGNTGRVGVIVQREAHPGSFDIVKIKDAAGHVFATRLSNAFVIGKGASAKDALITLPRGQGVKRDIFQERDARMRAAKD